MPQFHLPWGVDEMPQLHLLCWDTERRLSEHPSRRQREPDARDENSQLHLLARPARTPGAVHDPAVRPPEPRAHEGGGGSHAAKAEGGPVRLSARIGTDLRPLQPPGITPILVIPGDILVPGAPILLDIPTPSGVKVEPSRRPGFLKRLSAADSLDFVLRAQRERRKCRTSACPTLAQEARS